MALISEVAAGMGAAEALLETLDEPEAKASMIWIIGEYAQRIDNSDELLDSFLGTFHDETPHVQLQLKNRET